MLVVRQSRITAANVLISDRREGRAQRAALLEVILFCAVGLTLSLAAINVGAYAAVDWF